MTWLIMKGPKGLEVETMVLLDSGSTVSMITQSLAEELQLEVVGQFQGSIIAANKTIMVADKANRVAVEVEGEKGITDSLSLIAVHQEFPSSITTLDGVDQVLTPQVIIGSDILKKHMVEGDTIDMTWGTAVRGRMWPTLMNRRKGSKWSRKGTAPAYAPLVVDQPKGACGKSRKDDEDAESSIRSSIRWREGRAEVGLPWKKDRSDLLADTFGASSGAIASSGKKVSS
eukprot:GHVS01105472.1.p1 GENE.GHVS01105472.1~~GHVS01105472.1.p1  ORF type:complete len:229 (+),score=18.19 GHVS01105472.1:99-785(+)